MKYEAYLDIPAYIRRGKGLTESRYNDLIKAGFNPREIVEMY